MGNLVVNIVLINIITKQKIKMKGFKRLQELAGIEEIKVTNPTSLNLKYCWIDNHEDYHILNLTSEINCEKYK
jgi:hypothetical protein